jgi:Domain of unknown function (DUF4129)
MTLARFGPAAITAIGLLLALAGALAPTEEGTASGSLATRLIIPLPDWLVVATVAALAAASLILLAIILPRPRPRRKKGEDPYELYYEPRKAPPTVVVLLILLALTPPGILAASILWLDRHDVLLHGGTAGAEKVFPPASPSPTARQSHPGDLPPRSASPVTAHLLGALALLAGFGSLGVMLWLRFGDRLWRSSPDAERSSGELAAAVEESLEDLQLEPDARTAIVKCYRRFEHFLAAAEYPRAPWETPIEFMSTALRKLPLPSAAVASLTGLFEIARFSQHAVGASEREDAFRSLSEIREALDHSKEEPDAAPA